MSPFTHSTQTTEAYRFFGLWLFCRFSTDMYAQGVLMRCSQCGENSTWDSCSFPFLRSLPPQIHYQLPFVAVRQGIYITPELLELVRSCGRSESWSWSHLATSIEEAHLAQYLKLEADYNLRRQMWLQTHCETQTNTLKDFGGYSECEGFNGFSISCKTLREIYVLDFFDREPFIAGAMAKVLCRAMKLDVMAIKQLEHGAGYPKHIVVLNEFLEIVKFAFIASESIDELKLFVSELGERLNRSGCECKDLWMDMNCCNGQLLAEDELEQLRETRHYQLWRTLNNEIKLHLDEWHWHKRFARGFTNPKHPYARTFNKEIMNAVFDVDFDDMSRLVHAAMQHYQLGEFEAKKKLTKRDIQMHVKRSIRDRPVMLRKLNDVRNLFQQKTYHGDPLFGPDFKDVWNQNMVHVKMGCLDDPRHIPLFRELPDRAFFRGNQNLPLPVYAVTRSTSHVESSNRSTRGCFHGTNAGGDLSHAVTSDNHFLWTQHRRRDGNRPYLPLVDLPLLNYANETHRAIYNVDHPLIPFSQLVDVQAGLNEHFGIRYALKVQHDRRVHYAVENNLLPPAGEDGLLSEALQGEDLPLNIDIIPEDSDGDDFAEVVLEHATNPDLDTCPADQLQVALPAEQPPAQRNTTELATALHKKRIGVIKPFPVSFTTQQEKKIKELLAKHGPDRIDAVWLEYSSFQEQALEADRSTPYHPLLEVTIRKWYKLQETRKHSATVYSTPSIAADALSSNAQPNFLVPQALWGQSPPLPPTTTMPISTNIQLATTTVHIDPCLKRALQGMDKVDSSTPILRTNLPACAPHYEELFQSYKCFESKEEVKPGRLCRECNLQFYKRATTHPEVTSADLQTKAKWCPIAYPDKFLWESTILPRKAHARRMQKDKDRCNICEKLYCETNPDRAADREHIQPVPGFDLWYCPFNPTHQSYRHWLKHNNKFIASHTTKMANIHKRKQPDSEF